MSLFSSSAVLHSSRSVCLVVFSFSAVSASNSWIFGPYAILYKLLRSIFSLHDLATTWLSLEQTIVQESRTELCSVSLDLTPLRWSCMSIFSLISLSLQRSLRVCRKAVCGSRRTLLYSPAASGRESVPSDKHHLHFHTSINDEEQVLWLRASTWFWSFPLKIVISWVVFNMSEAVGVFMLLFHIFLWSDVWSISTKTQANKWLAESEEWETAWPLYCQQMHMYCRSSIAIIGPILS